MEYPYKQVGQRFYPVIPVNLMGSIIKRTHALIDSGSMLSLFRKEVADELGIVYKSGKPARITSVHGEMMVYVHSLRFMVQEKEFTCHVGFSDEFKANVNLLGRIDFFEQFKITFDEHGKKVILESY